MFTGIVEHQGLVAALRQEPWGARLEVDPCGWPHAPRDGDSIAVNGCCLTVVGTPVAGGPLRFDVVPQTLGLTTVGALRAGDRVNLEHAATASTLLGGHLVQGHVDGIGEVLAVSEAGGEWRTRIAAPPSVQPYLVERGSVAVDGVSLTVAACGPGWFEVALIPETLERTTLRERLDGARVNIEPDVMARMIAAEVRRQLEQRASGRAAPAS